MRLPWPLRRLEPGSQREGRGGTSWTRSGDGKGGKKLIKTMVNGDIQRFLLYIIVLVVIVNGDIVMVMVNGDI